MNKKQFAETYKLNEVFHFFDIYIYYDKIRT